MCGFAGALKRNGEPHGSDIPSVLELMGEQIAYRGPDDKQFYQDGEFASVFHRLSIVDIEGGRQPLFNEDRSLVLMVNGEIYNHQDLKSRLRDDHLFRTRSDCEIIVHLYEERGIDFIGELNGMFALVLWDRRSCRLILARDRLGIKPLYYSCSEQRLLFASEIKALFPYPDCPREFDWQKALSFHTHRPYSKGFLPSFFKGIEYLPGGTLLIADLKEKTVNTKCYWDLVPLSDVEYAQDQRTEKEIIDGYAAILSDAVRIRMMADTEVGIFLSGGIDSAAITAYASRYRPLHTFSVLSQSTFQNGDARAGHRFSKHLGLPNHQVLFSWHDMPLDPQQWKNLLWLCETPLCEAEHLYKYHLHRFARHLRPDLKVMLLGQGSDEFNGGYGSVYVDKFYPDHDDASGNWTLFMTIMENLEKEHLLTRVPGMDQFGGLINKNFVQSCSNRIGYRHPWFYHMDIYRKNLQMYNLWHEDRTAAGNSIENRVPFLDHRLVEFCAAISPEKYETLFWNKRILRQAVRPILPAEFADRPKCPFFYGDDVRFTRRMIFDLLMTDDRQLIREAFGDADGCHPVFDRQTIEQFITGIPEDPDYPQTDLLLGITNMGLLEKMAEDVYTWKQNDPSIPIMPEIRISDWDAQKDQLALKLAIRKQRPEPDFNCPVDFTPDTLLLKRDTVAPDAKHVYISVNDQIEYELKEEKMKDWLNVLRRIDGRRSINDILNELELPMSRIRKHMEEALDYRIIYFKSSSKRR